MKRLLTEPLLHFLLAGAALFAAYTFIGRGAADRSAGANPIVRIGEGEVSWLRETWVRQWQRPPTQAELRGLVTEFLKEELLAREARAMALDENDTIVRRRLAQKLEFLMQDTVRLAEPSAEDLRHFYDAHPELFRAPGRVSFSQIFFSREQRHDARADAKAALVALSKAAGRADAAQFGDSLLIDADFRDADEASVEAQFGAEFGKSLFALTPGGWQGPIESAYGLHLVRVDELAAPAQRAFADVSTQVLARWRAEREREQGEQYFAALLKKYDVAIDDSVKPLVGPLDGPIGPASSGSGEGEVQ